MTLLTSIMSISYVQPAATQSVPGLAPLATLAEVQAATDNQKVVTPADLGSAYIGYYAPGRAYPPGSIVAYAGVLYCNRSGAPTATAPPSGLAWGPVDNKSPVVASNLSMTAYAGGSGTLASPFVVSPGNVPSGASGVVLTQISIIGLTPGVYVELADVNAATNGNRFSVSNRLVNGQGALKFNVVYTDSPASPASSTYTMLLKIGMGGGAYVSYVGTVV